MKSNGKKLWLKVFNDLKNNSIESAPRGQKIKEILNYSIKLHPIRDRFCSFEERNLNMRYLSGEFAWYLRGDLNDTSIVEYSKFWNKIKSENSPYWNSNYGYYFFTQKQFEHVIKSLTFDKDSRQAAVIINNKDVMMSESADKICTYSVSFNIRKNKLNMIVNMRSNDVIRGFCIDVVMFSFIYEMIYNELKRIYTDLKIGNYWHNADSFHIYELHWGMMDSIIENNGENYKVLDIPEIHKDEVGFLRTYFLSAEETIRKNLDNDWFKKIPKQFKFTKKLIEFLDE